MCHLIISTKRPKNGICGIRFCKQSRVDQLDLCQVLPDHSQLYSRLASDDSAKVIPMSQKFRPVMAITEPSSHDWNHLAKLGDAWAVFVAQLIERLLPIPEIHGLNPVIGNMDYLISTLLKLYWKDEIKEKRPGMAQFLKISGGRSSVGSYAPSILRPRVWIPCTPSMLFHSLTCTAKLPSICENKESWK